MHPSSILYSQAKQAVVGIVSKVMSDRTPSSGYAVVILLFVPQSIVYENLHRGSEFE